MTAEKKPRSKKAAYEYLDGYIKDFRQLRKLSRKELVEVGGLLIQGDIDGLRELAENTRAPALHSVFAKIICRIYDTGDIQAFNTLINQLVGPPRNRDDTITVNPIASENSQVIVTLPSNGREVRQLPSGK